MTCIPKIMFEHNFQFLVTVGIISRGCHIKIPQTDWHNGRNLFSQF